MHENLYPQILKKDWHSLPPKLRTLFGDEEKNLIVQGHFTLKNYPSFISALIYTFMNLPTPVENIPTTITINRNKNEEIWTRKFAHHEPFIMSHQRFINQGILAEKIGSFEFYFNLQFKNSQLEAKTVAVALCLGSFRLALPPILSPYIYSNTWLNAQQKIEVEANVNVPLIGSFLSYKGIVDSIKETDNII